MKKALVLLCLLLPSSAMASNAYTNLVSGLLVLLAILLFWLLVYFIPTFIAHYRKAVNFKTVFWVNLLLGWSGIGWLVALILAFVGDSGAQVQRHREMLAALQRNQQPPQA